LLTLTRIPHEKIVKIHVGKALSTKTFIIHVDFLTNCSRFFSAAFNGEFIEGTTKTMTYEEMTPLAFGLFINWAYTQKLINSCSVRAVSELFNLRWEFEIECRDFSGEISKRQKEMWSAF
jgi:hypothetical protein